MTPQQLLMPMPESDSDDEEEPPTERPPSKKKKEKDDDDGFTKLPAKKYGKNQLPPEKEGFWCITFELHEKRLLDGTSEFRYGMSSACTNPLDMMGGHYGFYGPPDEDGPLTDCFESWMTQKKADANDLYWPFTEEQAKIEAGRYRYLYYEFRVLPLSNYFIIIPDKMIELLLKEGFDFEAWYEEFKAIPENQASKKDFDRGMRILKLIDKGENLSIESRPLKQLEWKLKEMGLEGDVLGLFHRDELTKKMHDVGLTLYKIDQQIIKLRKTLRTCRYLITGDIRIPREFGHQTDDFGITCESGAVLMPNITVER